jgi:hypothetical protein
MRLLSHRRLASATPQGMPIANPRTAAHTANAISAWASHIERLHRVQGFVSQRIADVMLTRFFVLFAQWRGANDNIEPSVMG